MLSRGATAASFCFKPGVVFKAHHHNHNGYFWGAGPPITLVFTGKLKEILLSIPNLMWLLTSLKALAEFDTTFFCFMASLRCGVTVISRRPCSLKPKRRHLRLSGSWDTDARYKYEMKTGSFLCLWALIYWVTVCTLLPEVKMNHWRLFI